MKLLLITFGMIFCAAILAFIVSACGQGKQTEANLPVKDEFVLSVKPDDMKWTALCVYDEGKKIFSIEGDGRIILHGKEIGTDKQVALALRYAIEQKWPKPGAVPPTK